MSIKILLLLALLPAPTLFFCLFGCDKQEDKASVVAQTGVTVDNVHNATVLVAVIKNLEDSHHAHFSTIKMGVWFLIGLAVLVVSVLVLKNCIKRCQDYAESYADRRGQAIARSIIRKYDHKAQESTTTKV